MPVFINNDGDLYAYGEALAGSLPFINKILTENNSSKRYQNLVGLTIGTGFGAGIVNQNRLLRGDNMCAGEIWTSSNRVDNNTNSEEGVSIRAVRYFFAEYANISLEKAPDPKTIFEIGTKKIEGNQIAAQKAYFKLGRFIGDSIANLITLTDGIVIIGGGVAGAKELIIPGIAHELMSEFTKLNGEKNKRLTHKVFCLNNSAELEEFVKDKSQIIKVPFSTTEVVYDIQARAAYMFSEFDTSEMISLGAFYYAINELNLNY
jgi:glucokinase